MKRNAQRHLLWGWVKTPVRLHVIARWLRHELSPLLIDLLLVWLLLHAITKLASEA